MKKLTQWQLIERHLLQGNSLTVMQATKELNITCLRSRVSDLRKRNIPVLSHTIKFENGFCYRYYLPDDYIQANKGKYDEL